MDRDPVPAMLATSFRITRAVAEFHQRRNLAA
jgi:hypothetical protein